MEKFVLCMIKRWKLVIASIVDRIERRPSSISKLDSPHMLWKLKFIPHYINLEFRNFEVLLLDLGQGPFIDDIYASSLFARHGRNPLSFFFFFWWHHKLDNVKMLPHSVLCSTFMKIIVPHFYLLSPPIPPKKVSN